MLRRPSSRLLVLDAAKRLLLFRFQHRDGALAGQSFWATPGGGVEDGETFEQAAQRELWEEVGLVVGHPGPQIAQRIVSFALPTGEMVEADERYFVIQTEEAVVSDAGWTALERSVMAECRWWAQSELLSTADQVWPETLNEILVEVGVWTAAH
jgi:8-oxo-dGTP pyrophosphatase MutT (NUDIX family)